GQADRALLVAEVVEEDRQRELARTLALVGPFEAVAREALDLVVLIEPPPVGRDDQPIDGALALVGRHVFRRADRRLTPPGARRAPGRHCRRKAPRPRPCRARRSSRRAGPPALPPRPARPRA